MRTSTARLVRLGASAMLAVGLLLPASGVAAAGPPYPAPVDGQAVYDTAGALRDTTISRLEQQIDAIEARTGAEVVVYTQLVPDGITEVKAERDAIALMDQWGVGRKGIDDGLVILFDLNEDDPCHGQVQLYAGPGYKATYLSNDDRQRLFDEQLLPRLRQCDIDGAALTAMDAVDANATPEHAARIALFRQLDAVLGLVVAPLVVVVILAWALLTWFRVGRDPVYLDDPSILMPTPPPGLTPAAGALVRDGQATRRVLTAASLDLAVRGLIQFEANGKPGLLATGDDISIRTVERVTHDAAEGARIERARRRPMDPGTAFLLQHLEDIAGSSGLITPVEMLKLGSNVDGFEHRVEDHVVQSGWMTDRPSRAVSRWNGRITLLFVLGIGAIVAGANLPSQGLLLVGGALIAGSIGLAIFSRVMPSVTRDGAVIRAMLEAYRRTLEKTMAQARSMGQVVEESAIPLIESPDDAIAWGVALGLQREVERVLERTADDTRRGVTGGYLPGWYGVGGGGGSGWGGGGGGGLAPGLMSSSPIPNFGGMMAALSTIGNSPASSGSGGGGGGFSGGSSGGGGGGAGGGF